MEEPNRILIAFEEGRLVALHSVLETINLYDNIPIIKSTVEEMRDNTNLRLIQEGAHE
jgi:hypothetical protein